MQWARWNGRGGRIAGALRSVLCTLPRRRAQRSRIAELLEHKQRMIAIWWKGAIFLHIGVLVYRRIFAEPIRSKLWGARKRWHIESAGRPQHSTGGHRIRIDTS